jgi:AraC-like DNA-binding protein
LVEDETYQIGLDRRVNPDQDEVLRFSESARGPAGIATNGRRRYCQGSICRGQEGAPRRRTLIKNSDLTLLQAEKPDIRIPVKSQIKFLNAVASALPDDLLGVHLAQSVDLRELGLLYYVVASSESLGDALMRVARYSAIQNEGMRIACRHRRQMISIRFDYVGVTRVGDRHQIEFFATILLRLCRAITGRRLSAERVRFSHRRGSVPVELAKLFACDIEFGARGDEIMFPLSVKGIRIVNADPYLNALLLRYCDEIVSQRRMKSGDWRANVENAMAPLLPHAEATMDNVARQLGVSRRTLARRLASENASFSGVLNELRRSLAKRCLQERELKLAEIAWLLGYQEFSAFSHACKRWTGSSPRELRSSGWSVRARPATMVVRREARRGAQHRPWPRTTEP